MKLDLFKMKISHEDKSGSESFFVLLWLKNVRHRVLSAEHIEYLCHLSYYTIILNNVVLLQKISITKKIMCL